ncbi:hypothetical protein G7Z17_g803 [Cylindrodendrum hubeiense]|uniref:Uncharacterized protein n=1 Tax=Cylindrodendrum hubeiense TaxID=595255 RepID=A0A9P5LD13_9HYPO|nr:hypothetical protein G7Z17_g803 [Cylindrodendrum hubeiense]
MTPFFDWLAVIDEENLGETSNNSLNLAHSSAMEVLPDARASDATPPGEGVTMPTTALSNLAGIDPVVLETWTIGERHLLNHFLQSVARSMAMVDDADNPFLSVIVPMAFENDAGVAGPKDAARQHQDHLLGFGSHIAALLIRDHRGVHPLFGIAPTLYECLARTNRLEKRKGMDANPETIRIEAEAIDLALQSWSPPDTNVLVGPEPRAAAFARGQWDSGQLQELIKFWMNFGGGLTEDKAIHGESWFAA